MLLSSLQHNTAYADSLRSVLGGGSHSIPSISKLQIQVKKDFTIFWGNRRWKKSLIIFLTLNGRRVRPGVSATANFPRLRHVKKVFAKQNVRQVCQKRHSPKDYLPTSVFCLVWYQRNIFNALDRRSLVGWFRRSGSGSTRRSAEKYPKMDWGDGNRRILDISSDSNRPPRFPRALGSRWNSS